ncbi:MAG TPA: hypothetical protein VGF18_06875, partial [Candidatus Tumulicola sp.]
VSPRIRRRGITGVTAADISAAARHDARIRLVAAAVRCGDRVAAEVGPVIVASGHPFARAAGAENVVEIRARDAGRLVLSGIGAGGSATASAVLGDLDSTLRAIGRARTVPGLRASSSPSPALDVVPLFPSLQRLPGYPVWNDTCFDGVPGERAELSIAGSAAAAR